MSEQNGGPLTAAEIKAKQLNKGPVYAAVFLDGIGPARVYAMNTVELAKFTAESRRRAKRDPQSVREGVRLVIACLKDTEGNPVYTPADEDALAALPVSELLRVVRAANKVNGFSDEDDDAGN